MSIQNDNGRRDEKSLCQEIFQKNHYWAYNCPKGQSGAQPVDVIAMNGYGVFLVDAKNVEKGKQSFPFTRVEQNQFTSMKYAVEWSGIDPQRCGFVIFFEEDELPRYMNYENYIGYVNEGKKSINRYDLPFFSEILEAYKK